MFEYLLKLILKTRGLFELIGLPENIFFEDIAIIEKEIQKIPVKKQQKKKKRFKFNIPFI